MIQILYIVAFTALSILAVANLIRSMLSLAKAEPAPHLSRRLAKVKSLHPELLDQQGNISQEPLLVMRAYTIDDARARLDALYEASSNSEI
ncbi:MAG: DUF2973 domain-containing protein [Pseudanabaenaceae cyanobacterium bins.68]|nr:DUF2973 domain-containing protein [Pseudanabaenaceae cyanobacterium bins.68]